MIDTTELYSLILVLMALIFIENLGMWNQFDVKGHKVTQTFAMVDYVHEIAAKKFCK